MAPSRFPSYSVRPRPLLVKYRMAFQFSVEHHYGAWHRAGCCIASTDSGLRHRYRKISFAILSSWDPPFGSIPVVVPMI